MRELRTQESKKFENFFELVRQEASKEHSIFFVDCGEGHEFFADDMEGEDLSGWLIPEASADTFQKAFDDNKVSIEWDDFMRMLKWKKQGGRIAVAFENF